MEKVKNEFRKIFDNICQEHGESEESCLDVAVALYFATYYNKDCQSCE